MSSKDIGILGGTFNPIHNQHLLLAKKAYEQLQPDKILLIPSGISYLKEGTNVLSADKRYEMCRLAVSGIPYIELSDIELKRKGNSYTCDTLKELSLQYPDAEFYYIIGADSLFMLENWRNPEYIFSNCILTVASRIDRNNYTDEKLKQKITYYEERYDARIRVLEINISDLSSSMIRQAAAKGEDIRYFVPEDVADYIIKNGLYR